MNLTCNSCDGMYDSLDVRFTKCCDNDCSFCIEKGGLENRGHAATQIIVKQTFRSGIDNVLIVGGEPFLRMPQLLEYVSSIRKFVNKIYITTSMPQTMQEHRDILDKIMSQIDGLNVSVQSIDNDSNNDVLNASNPWNRISFLRNVLLKKYPDKVRVNLNLVRGGIYGELRLVGTLLILQASGCKTVKLNELQNSDKYVSYEEIMQVKLPSPYSHGCQTEVHIPGITMKVILKRSCFIVEQSRKATWSDLVKAICRKFIRRTNKFAVLYEDGSISDGWKKCQS